MRRAPATPVVSDPSDGSRTAIHRSANPALSSSRKTDERKTRLQLVETGASTHDGFFTRLRHPAASTTFAIRRLH